jgi:dTDP-glucose 4,6-dehydratase
LRRFCKKRSLRKDGTAREYYENLWQTNVIGTKHIIRLQEKLKFRMIFFSSAEVYGDYEGVMREEVMENNPII